MLLKRYGDGLLKKIVDGFTVCIALGLLQACGSLPEGPVQTDEQVAPVEDSAPKDVTQQPETPNQQQPEIPGHVQESYTKALALMNANQIEQAISILKSLTENDPALSGPFVNLGIAYQKIDNNDEAEKAIQKAIEINPENPAAHNQLGILQRKRGDFEAAQNSYQTLLATHPDYLYAHLNLGILCDLYLQNIECALDHYKKYLELTEEEDKQVKLWVADLEKRGEGVVEETQ